MGRIAPAGDAILVAEGRQGDGGGGGQDLHGHLVLHLGPREVLGPHLLEEGALLNGLLGGGQGGC